MTGARPGPVRRRPRRAIRSTPQRRAIRRAFETAGRPLAPEECLALARREVPRLGPATVYRNIRRLVDEGRLRAVELPGAPARYELPREDHHHHFHCRVCDGVFEVDDCPGGFGELAPGGFRLERHEVILYGLCAGCAG